MTRNQRALVDVFEVLEQLRERDVLLSREIALRNKSFIICARDAANEAYTDRVMITTSRFAVSALNVFWSARF